eukprot:1143443-Pelagomonas_calceolata.AAC.2
MYCNRKSPCMLQVSSDMDLNDLLGPSDKSKQGLDASPAGAFPAGTGKMWVKVGPGRLPCRCECTFCFGLFILMLVLVLAPWIQQKHASLEPTIVMINCACCSESGSTTHFSMVSMVDSASLKLTCSEPNPLQLQQRKAKTDKRTVLGSDGDVISGVTWATHALPEDATHFKTWSQSKSKKLNVFSGLAVIWSHLSGSKTLTCGAPAYTPFPVQVKHQHPSSYCGPCGSGFAGRCDPGGGAFLPGPGIYGAWPTKIRLCKTATLGCRRIWRLVFSICFKGVVDLQKSAHQGPHLTANVQMRRKAISLSTLACHEKPVFVNQDHITYTSVSKR